MLSGAALPAMHRVMRDVVVFLAAFGGSFARQSTPTWRWELFA